MTALQLFLLGRRLTKLAEEAMRASGAEGVKTSVQLILQDVHLHPDAAISEITARTGLPQSYVSSVVRSLGDAGMLEIRQDPADGRRTLVCASRRLTGRLAARGRKPVDEALAGAFGLSGSGEPVETIAVLERLSARLAAGGIK